MITLQEQLDKIQQQMNDKELLECLKDANSTLNQLKSGQIVEDLQEITADMQERDFQQNQINSIFKNISEAEQQKLEEEF